MTSNKWFNITRFSSAVFAVVTVVFIVLTSNPSLVKDSFSQSFLFSSTLFFGGLSILLAGIHVLIHEKQRESAATMIFVGSLALLGGAFFLIFALE